VEGIHAFLAYEAEGTELGKLAVDVGLLGSSLKLKNHVLHIPSAFNFLVMKLNATRVNRLRHIASIALTNNG